MEEEMSESNRNEKLKYHELGRKIGEELVRTRAGSQLNLAIILLFVVGVYLLFEGG
jgi:hypothetical protein